MTELDALRILGITAARDEAEVKRAWRQVVKQTHPDLHPNDRGAAERFQQVQEAYDLLRIRVSAGPVSIENAARSPAFSQELLYRRPAQHHPATRPPPRPAPAPPIPRPVPWRTQRGTWRWWVYVIFWKASAIPFIALLAWGIGQHREFVAAQRTFEHAPVCATDATRLSGCVKVSKGNVVSEDCRFCSSATSVGDAPEVTVDVDGVRTGVRVVAISQADKEMVYNFDHVPGADTVTIREWQGAVVAVAELPTKDSPLRAADAWPTLIAAMAVPIGWIVLMPPRVVDLTFRMIAMLVFYGFRLVVQVLTRA